MPKSITQLNASNIICFFFDIDDTFSSHGKITPDAYDSLWKIKASGLKLVPVTGRPAGWCDHIARMWPVDAVIGENGALYYMMSGGKLVKKYVASEESRNNDVQKLKSLGKEILKKIPGTALASDQFCRLFDLAIDFREDVLPVSMDNVKKIVEIATEHGAISKISSIHVNIWFGNHTKLTTTKLFIKNELGLDAAKDNDRFAFAGDSGNDEPMFEFFKNSIGVANVLEFKNIIKKMPNFITEKESGAGFCEIAKVLAKR